VEFTQEDGDDFKEDEYTHDFEDEEEQDEENDGEYIPMWAKKVFGATSGENITMREKANVPRFTKGTAPNNIKKI